MPAIGAVPAPLVRAFEKDGSRVVAFVCSGLSAAAGLPNWAKLIMMIGEELGLAEDIRSYVASGRYVDAVGYLARTHSEEAVQDLAAQLIRVAANEPTSAHGSVVRLPLQGILTTNFDMLLADADRAVERRRAPRYGEPATWRTSGLRVKRQSPFILHVHGNVDDPRSIVLSRRTMDVSWADARFDDLREFVRSVFYEHTLLFIGCGFRDDTVTDLVADLRRDGALGALSVYAIVHDKSPERPDPVRHASLQDRWINPIYVPSGTDHGFEGTTRWLQELGQVVESVRRGVGDSVAAKARPEVVRLAIEVLSDDSISHELAAALLGLPCRPDLHVLAKAGINRDDIPGVVARVTAAELRMMVIRMGTSVHVAEVRNLLTCLTQ